MPHPLVGKSVEVRYRTEVVPVGVEGRPVTIVDITEGVMVYRNWEGKVFAVHLSSTAGIRVLD